MGRLAKPPKDPRGQHLRIYKDIYSSPAWLALSFTERALYVAMRQRLNSFNNGTIVATPSTLAADGFSSSSTLHKSLRALIAVGLIECVVKGRMTFGGKEASLFRFTDEECFDVPKRGLQATKPTCEWTRLSTVDEAAAAIATAHKDAKRPNHPNSKAARASKVPISNRKGSKIEPERMFSDSDSRPWETSSILNSSDGNCPQTRGKPASMLAPLPPPPDFSDPSHRSNFEHQCIVATPAPQAQPMTPRRMAAGESIETLQ